jgi:hypothetical protein
MLLTDIFIDFEKITIIPMSPRQRFMSSRITNYIHLLNFREGLVERTEQGMGRQVQVYTEDKIENYNVFNNCFNGAISMA